VISAAVDKHVYISSNATFTPDYFLKYSALEWVEHVADIDDPIMREVLLAQRSSACARRSPWRTGIARVSPP
jgi:hypothetical protein